MPAGAVQRQATQNTLTNTQDSIQKQTMEVVCHLSAEGTLVLDESRLESGRLQDIQNNDVVRSSRTSYTWSRRERNVKKFGCSLVSRVGYVQCMDNVEDIHAVQLRPADLDSIVSARLSRNNLAKVEKAIGLLKIPKIT